MEIMYSFNGEYFLSKIPTQKKRHAPREKSKILKKKRARKRNKIKSSPPPRGLPYIF